MSAAASQQAILTHLSAVDHERQLRGADAALQARVSAVKQYQQKRFQLTYADLLASPRYSGAARFFLDELYGPADFSQRDAQFARVVPALVRLFPADIVSTVASLASLHALSEQLDTRMGQQLQSAEVNAGLYAKAWQAASTTAQRSQQIEQMLSVGRSLDQLTRQVLIRQSLRFMRAPARAAGLSALQTFLESGFDTFRAMKGAEPFLSLIFEREHSLAKMLFETDPATLTNDANCLGQLP
ncbi:MAG: hypothetical protein RLZZ618_2017 [Pseudomonadota bacterium]|jgi:hypothetical protein